MVQVVTLNCQKAFQQGFKPYVKEILETRRYDFLLLQEVDQKVLEIIRPIYKEFGYTRLSATHPGTSFELYTCILYKNEYEFLRSDFITFSPMVLQQITETGSIAGVFKVPLRLRRYIKRKKILLIATHLHASYHWLARKKEILQLKNQALHLDPKDECLKIIAGDFNNLIGNEEKTHNYLMSPQFTNVSNFKDPTYDSQYIEPKYKNAVYGKLYFSIAKRYKGKLDHMYMDTKSANRLSYTCNVVDVIASDHKPVELKFSKKERRKILPRLRRDKKIKINLKDND